MSLVELLLALALSSLLTITLVQVAMAARSSFRLQEGLAELQENARYFADLLVENISDSGFHPQPWLHDPTPIGLMPDTADAIDNFSDRLVTRSWSDRNCFGSSNPVLAVSGKPEFFLKESALELNAGSLAHTCRYGPAADALVTQINRQGAIPEVEAFQAVYAIDENGDGQIDRWARARDWVGYEAGDEPGTTEVLAVRLGILSRSRESIASPVADTFRILDFNYAAPADGRLRRVSSYTLPLQSRQP
ncbi:MAG TPA: PilW family protein [Xanthomonadales bacterium]|nr:PilW family protein [Xanthomonadales bacterium]